MDHQGVANPRAIVSGNQPAAVAFSVAGESGNGTGFPFLPKAPFIRDTRNYHAYPVAPYKGAERRALVPPSPQIT